MPTPIFDPPNYESGGQEFEISSGAPKVPVFCLDLGRRYTAMQNANFCMASVWHVTFELFGLTNDTALKMAIDLRRGIVTRRGETRNPGTGSKGLGARGAYSAVHRGRTRSHNPASLLWEWDDGSPTFRGYEEHALCHNPVDPASLADASCEAQGRKSRDSAPSHYPTSCWDVEYGHVGWSVQDPQPGEMRILCRTPLANGLLAIAAV